MSTPVVQALASQVGGHAGVMTTEDGSLLIKPALKRELEFYQRLQSDKDEAIATLRQFTPKFLGTLTLEGEAKEGSGDGGALEIKPAAELNTPKSYGKSIKPSDLPDGIARFFPVGSDSLEGAPEEPKQGLPRHVLLPVLKAVRAEIAEIKGALSKIEFRMVGGSILVIYEAEWERADAAIKRYVEESKRVSEKAGQEEEEEGEEDDDEEDDDEENIPPPAFTVKLIDFAHTRVEAGLGPDEGVLLGIDTVLRLLDGRIQQLESEKAV
ncbi:hypothetical protein H1R20_g500, partial [Candolleomyces eurysporus]